MQITTLLFMGSDRGVDGEGDTSWGDNRGAPPTPRKPGDQREVSPT